MANTSSTSTCLTENSQVSAVDFYNVRTEVGSMHGGLRKESSYSVGLLCSVFYRQPLSSVSNGHNITGIYLPKDINALANAILAMH